MLVSSSLSAPNRPMPGADRIVGVSACGQIHVTYDPLRPGRIRGRDGDVAPAGAPVEASPSAFYRRPLSSPAFETRNGTTKFKAHRTHVAVVA